MFDSYKKTRASIGRGLFAIFFFGFIAMTAGFAGVPLAHAEEPVGPAAGKADVAAEASKSLCTTSGMQPSTCPGTGISGVLKSVWANFIAPATKLMAAKAIIDLSTFVANRVAYEAAMLIANGGPGQGSMFYKKSGLDAWTGLGKDVAGQAIADLSDITKSTIGLDLCLPPNPILRLNLQLGIRQSYVPQTPRCNFDQVINNWTQLASDTQGAFKNPFDRDRFLYKTLADGLRPGNNQLGATIGFLNVVNEQAQRKAQVEFADQLAKKAGANGFKDVTDFVTGNVKTPAQIAAKSFDEKIKKAESNPKSEIGVGDLLSNSDIWMGLLTTAGSTFTNTLTSQLFNRVYKGLFDPKSTTSTDPFAALLPGNANSLADSQADLGAIFTARPVENSQFDLLSEFAQCPPDGVTNRGLNQCVLDSGVITALNQGNITLREAIDKKIIKGDWPMISSENVQANNDRLCYTYGWCYGNLVKMRKARLIPIGWELAANKQSLSAPLSLRQVMEAFNDCNANGEMDASHPWCHLVDPNWVLTAPEQRCLASVNGEIRVGAQTAGRQSACANVQTCIGEDNAGNCVQGYGYCVAEKNIWRMKGDECPAQDASCLTLKNTHSGKSLSYLLNTVDVAECSKQNAGCLWFKTQKTQDDTGAFQWFTGSSAYNVATQGGWMKYDGSTASTSNTTAYSYQDRVYLTHAATSCTQDQAGCTELQSGSGLRLNMAQNGSFEADQDQNGRVDGWFGDVADLAIEADAGSLDGANVISPSGTIAQMVPVKSGGFFTASVFAATTGASGTHNVRVKAFDANNTELSLVGLNHFNGCQINSNGNTFRLKSNADSTVSAADGWVRQTCTFAVPANVAALEVQLSGNNVKFDGVQVEPGQLATGFHDGYAGTATKTFLKVAPSYLNCRGLATDPAECANYAQVCSATEVGCNLFAPKDGGTSVPAIASAVDACPNACVGYASYRQEATRYESVKPMVNFIATSAKSCPAQAVGCDGFTKLASAQEGGEAREYYTYLRSCVTPAMTGGSTTNTSSTYFTWQGSDTNGYQLETWQLLKSNLEAAPCSRVSQVGPETLVCNDAVANTSTNESAGVTVSTTWIDSSCRQHSDIFSNPDCREFFDQNGNIHYRLFTKTVAVDAACMAYRKDESTQDDCTASGGYWTEQGFCRYLGLQKESSACTEQYKGCRQYVGGTGRNTTTILNQTFENGTTEAFTEGSLSNDSVSTGGRSLATGASTSTTSTLLSGSFVKGKVYFLKFWAKGSGINPASPGVELDVRLQEGNTYFPPGSSTIAGFTLTSNWQAYSVGPIDTTSATFANLTGTNTQVYFGVGNGTMYLDNVEFIQSTDQQTLIKDSWVTPSVCDQTPDGTSSPQYYLGCRAYTDRKGADGSYYQFTNICSEKSIGCSAYFNTQNSSAPTGQVNNARCVNIGSGSLPNGAVVSTSTACVIEGNTYCTIAANKSFCTFDAPNMMLGGLPKNDTFGVVFGPETVVTPGDQQVYLVDNGQATCSEAYKGCREVGKPVYAQDKSTATFESIYVMDAPDRYADILCKNNELFCEEYSTAQDGNFYFKDPMDKTCEYRTGVKIGTQTINGWFKVGANAGTTQDLCYPTAIAAGNQAQIWRNGDTGYAGWVGTCSASSNRCTQFIDRSDTSPENFGTGKSYYVINDTKLTGDTTLASTSCNGRVGQKGGCALFNNTNSSQMRYNTSASYLVSRYADVLLNKQADDLVDPISCNAGGGEFTISSETAKKLYAHDLANDPNFVHATTNLTVNVCQRRCAYNLGTSNPSDVLISPYATTPTNPANSNIWNERSCLFNSDCPVLDSALRKDIRGTCRPIAYEGITGYIDTTAVPEPVPVTFAEGATDFRLQDDANTILNVNRDRTCAAWLACDASHSSWDPGSNKYVQVCDSVNLCTRSGSQGDQGVCQNWDKRDPVIMTDALYASRDVSWSGVDYSGYQIPYQMPTEHLTQFNLNPKKWCVLQNGTVWTAQNGTKQSCNVNADCSSISSTATCTDAPKDFRLVYNAGSCPANAQDGVTACAVGTCSVSGNACSSNTECTAAGDTCVTGMCRAFGATLCTSNVECAGIGTNTCDIGKGKCIQFETPSNGACTGGAVYIASPKAFVGTCYQSRCLTDIRDSVGEGHPDLLNENQTDNSQICRGYPEIDSPFPQKVVKTWKVFLEADPTKSELVYPNGSAILQFATGKDRPMPSEFVSGYSGSTVCAPIFKDGKWQVTDDCVCSYTKAVYAKGSTTRYYPPNTSGKTVLDGICSGGVKDGVACTSDAQCSATVDGKEVTGMCQLLSSTSVMYGWEGYCLEKDTSIQLNASTDPKDRACLTWLPVDQLAGTPDLYGKDVSAGFQVATDTYYCAEPKTAWDLHSTNYNGKTSGANYACAANNDLECSAVISDDEPFRNMWCPPKYFAVLGACDANGESGMCAESGVNDWPYFCVPENSYHQNGDVCETPTEFVQSGKIVNPEYNFPAHNQTYYFVGSQANFKAKQLEYADCAVRGVMDNVVLSSYLGTTSPNTLPTSGEGADSDGFRSLERTAVPYAACGTVVQTGLAQTDVSRPNAAWTDRLWNNSKNTFPVSSDARLAYTVNTLSTPFGKAEDPHEFNRTAQQIIAPRPLRVSVCQDGRLPLADFTCEKVGGKDQLLDYAENEGRVFGTFNVQSSIVWASNEWTDSSGLCANDLQCNTFATAETGLCNSGFCTGPNLMNGVSIYNNTCVEDADCLVNQCGTPSGAYFGKCSVKGSGASTSPAVQGFPVVAAFQNLQKLFAQSFMAFDYEFLSSQTYGAYKENPSSSWVWNSRVASKQSVPTVRSVGKCIGNSCFEGPAGVFTVNGQDSGDVYGVGSKKINVSFYVYADKNQMPLKRVMVDWGAASIAGLTVSSEDWPRSSQAGSTDDTNFYKNRRGLDVATSKELCDGSNFGQSPEACNSSYVLFSKDYVCSPKDLQQLRDAKRQCGAKDPATGSIITSPCWDVDNNNQPLCVFQPRVHAMDNWGWCTGRCTAGADGTQQCFENECDVNACPGGSQCADQEGGVADPWIYYNGTIRIRPAL